MTAAPKREALEAEIWDALDAVAVQPRRRKRRFGDFRRDVLVTARMLAERRGECGTVEYLLRVIYASREAEAVRPKEAVAELVDEAVQAFHNRRTELAADGGANG